MNENLIQNLEKSFNRPQRHFVKIVCTYKIIDWTVKLLESASLFVKTFCMKLKRLMLAALSRILAGSLCTPFLKELPLRDRDLMVYVNPVRLQLFKCLERPI